MAQIEILKILYEYLMTHGAPILSVDLFEIYFSINKYQRTDRGRWMIRNTLNTLIKMALVEANRDGYTITEAGIAVYKKHEF